MLGSGCRIGPGWDVSEAHGGRRGIARWQSGERGYPSRDGRRHGTAGGRGHTVNRPRLIVPMNLGMASETGILFGCDVF